jgi:REP element-mobilizing transposase RayT
MPDHVHLLAAPFEREEPVGNLSAAIKRWMRQELKAQWHWQGGSFDRLLRSSDSVDEKWAYIEQNPVRAGYITRAEDWPYAIGFKL